MTRLYLGPNIAKRAGDRGLVTIQHEYEMGYGESKVVAILFLVPYIFKKAGCRGFDLKDHR